MKLNINFLFLTIFIILLAIFVLFRPTTVANSSIDEIAQLEIKNFKLYELNQTATKIVASAKYAYKYSDRYEMYTINIDEKLKDAKQMKADFAKYSNDFLYLKGNVLLSINNEILFNAKELEYNQSSEKIYVHDDFIIKKESSYLQGKDLHYNVTSKKYFARDIQAKFDIQKDSF